MGRKAIEDKRKQFNRYVAGGTPALVKSLAAELGLSEGEVLDRAVQTLAICESFGPEIIKTPKKSDVIKTVDKVADDIQSGDPVQIISKTEVVRSKFVPPTGKFFKRS